jgi:hypothetical protein
MPIRTRNVKSRDALNAKATSPDLGVDREIQAQTLRTTSHEYVMTSRLRST